MDFVILGPTQLRVDGGTVPLGAAKQRGLLAILLYHAGESVRADMIVDHLWDGVASRSHRTSLYSLASRLRGAMRSAGLPGTLTREAGVAAYRLNVDPGFVDYHKFRRMVTEARDAAKRGDRHGCVALLDPAVRLWRSEPLAELRGAASEHLRRSMQEKLVGAQKFLIESELLIGHADLALARLEQLMSAHPFDEALARLWASALHAVGRRSDARAFAADFAVRYRKQMGIASTINVDDLVVPVRNPDRVTTGDGAADARAVGGAIRMRPADLPRGIPDFTGHEDLLAELDTAITGSTDGASAIVLAGMPGVGKTTLAVHWARRQREQFPDGQLYLNAEAHGPLERVRPEEALRQFLIALGVPAVQIPDDTAQRRALYNEELAGRRILVVVDNVGDSEQIRPLIPSSDTCRVVITSRNRLKGLTIREGIRTVTVPPLPESQRHVLLGQIIRTTRREAQPEALQSLARLSGGLPLALRIIGEHVAARPRPDLADLASELSTRLLDCEGDETDDATLRTVFAWSYQAIDPEAARLFRYLGLFPGSTFDVTAANALVDSDQVQVERLLDALARAHLINHDDVRRYRLHDLLWSYAVDQAGREIPPEERAAATRRLLTWYLLSVTNAVKLLAPEQPMVPDLPEPAVAPVAFVTDRDAMKWCEAERANLRALVRLAFREGFPRHAWQLTNAMHEVFDRYGRQSDTVELLHIALDAAIADGHGRGQVGTLINLGATHFALHDHGRAERAFEDGLRLARAVDFVEAEMACLHNLAVLHLKAGNVATAIRTYDQVLITCQTIGNLPGQAAVLFHLGDAHRQVGAHQEAIRCYSESLAIWEQAGSLRWQARVHVRLAGVRLEVAEPVSALNHCRLALDIYRHSTDEASRCEALITAADARRELGQTAEAVRDASEAITIGEQIADAVRRAHAMAVLADALRTAGDLSRARASCREGLEVVGDATTAEADPIRRRLRSILDAAG